MGGEPGSGTYRMNFAEFLKAFQADDDGYGGTVDIGLLNFTVQKRLPLKRKLSLTVQEDTTASIQILQDRLLSRAESQWRRRKLQKFSSHPVTRRGFGVTNFRVPTGSDGVMVSTEVFGFYSSPIRRTR